MIGLTVVMTISKLITTTEPYTVTTVKTVNTNIDVGIVLLLVSLSLAVSNSLYSVNNMCEAVGLYTSVFAIVCATLTLLIAGTAFISMTSWCLAHTLNEFYALYVDVNNQPLIPLQSRPYSISGNHDPDNVLGMGTNVPCPSFPSNPGMSFAAEMDYGIVEPTPNVTPYYVPQFIVNNPKSRCFSTSAFTGAAPNELSVLNNPQGTSPDKLIDLLRPVRKRDKMNQMSPFYQVISTVLSNNDLTDVEKQLEVERLVVAYEIKFMQVVIDTLQTEISQNTSSTAGFSTYNLRAKTLTR